METELQELNSGRLNLRRLTFYESHEDSFIFSLSVKEPICEFQVRSPLLRIRISLEPQQWQANLKLTYMFEGYRLNCLDKPVPKTYAVSLTFITDWRVVISHTESPVVGNNKMGNGFSHFPYCGVTPFD